MSKLQEKYRNEVFPALKEKYGIENAHQVPKVIKIVMNVGAGEAVHNSKSLEFIENDLTLISGQKPVIRKAKKSIAGFKLREGMPIGVMTTLRRQRMYEFLERLISIALPRVRDFKGISNKSFDGAGNYTLGVKEQLIFPEVDYDKTDKIRGLSITIVTSAKNDEQGKALLAVQPASEPDGQPASSSIPKAKSA